MPRDLAALAKESTLNQMPALAKEDNLPGPDAREQQRQQQESQTPLSQRIQEQLRDNGHGDDDPSESDEYESEPDDGPLGAIMSQRNEKRDQLHPYTQTLTMSDVESCVQLEEAAFPPNERCTREKFQYRLSTFGELSLGIFTSSDVSRSSFSFISEDEDGEDGDESSSEKGAPNDLPETVANSKPVYSGAPSRKSAMLGLICATRGSNSTVTDQDMKIPPEHQPDLDGRTVCIHSLAILPAYQGRGLGKTLMKAYLQRLANQGVVDRAALIAHDHLITYYENLGFENRGKSACTFGGGGWYDMVKEFRAGSVSP